MQSTANYFRVLDREPLAQGAFLIHFERRDLAFAPGQYLSLAPTGVKEQREYSIYSAPDQDRLTILAKEVTGGRLSPRLAKLKSGDELKVDGPYGFFRLNEPVEGQKFLFLATGTGISPFHCFIQSYPRLDYQLVHGIRKGEERALQQDIPTHRLVSCVSGPGEVLEPGEYPGRLTAWLKDHPVDRETQVYLCGNCAMIAEAFDILKHQGVPSPHIFTEVYF